MSRAASESLLIPLPGTYSMHRTTEVAQGIYFPYVKCQVSHLCQQAEEELVNVQPFSPVPALPE
jgi:hypothetical protein